MPKPDIVVLVWYRADQYAAVRALAADADRMEKTFQEWKILADEAFATAVRSGIPVKRVDFDNAAFMRWTSARNVQSTQQTRIQWAVEQASAN